MVGDFMDPDGTRYNQIEKKVSEKGGDIYKY